MVSYKGGLTYPCEVEKGHAIHKCDHCGGRGYLKFRTSKKKYKLEKLIKLIENWIENQIKLKRECFTAEELAAYFQAKISSVRHILHFLNLKGLISQKYNKPPHDCRRNNNPFDIGSDNSWSASFYQILK